jgi:ubiquinone/menaquinone biosynthesis C-methylase UbiE
MITLKNTLLNNPDFELRENVFFQKGIDSQTVFEQEYIALRKKEGRLYRDEEVSLLPEFRGASNLVEEWKKRNLSAQRLVQYLKHKNKLILDLGCGNGWLSNLISVSLSAQVVAMDLNEVELKQGARVFRPNPNLVHIYGDIFFIPFQPDLFDTIILASAIQYFEDLKKLIERLFHFLKPEGEIHILDSPLYFLNDIQGAIERSSLYFEKLGFPQMSQFYFHHSWKDLNSFNCLIRHNPRSLSSKLSKLIGRNQSPFPWICLSH